MVGKIIAHIITAISIIGGIVNIVKNDTSIAVVLFGASIILGILIATYDRWILWIRPVCFLNTKEDVYNCAEKVVENENILFCGKLDDKLLTIFEDAFHKKSGEKFVGQPKFSVNIFNSDPNFYSSDNLEQVQNVLKMDAQFDHFNHKFYFYRQNVNLLRGETNGKESLLLFFQSSEIDYNGVYIRKGSRLNIAAVIIKKVCPTVNIIGQLDNVRSVSEKSLEFWTPLKNGWFQPVFPPDDDAEVRKAWRNSLMSWFNSTAAALLEGGGKLTITWKIQEWSEKDAERFKDWLNKLKGINQGQKIKITRYMLISVEKYKSNPIYKKVVDNIVSTYLPTPLPRSSGDHYQIYFINRDKLTTELDDDLALFFLSNREKIAQDSEIDVKANIEVLKVIFSKDFSFVKGVEDKIGRLTSYNPKATLEDLIREGI